MRSVFDIEYGTLAQNGVELLIFDVDDTLSGHNGPIPGESFELLDNLSKRFAVALLSNCSLERKKELRDMVAGMPILIGGGQGKPDPVSYLKILGRCNAKPQQAAVIGDRPGVDLWGAMLAGIEERILVEPYSATHDAKKAPPPYRILRGLERWLSNI